MAESNHQKILIADDNDTNRRVIREMLSFRGYAPEVVESGEDAIEALQREPYDLLILDCVMPGINGFETAREIRESAPERLDCAIPILAVTALASKDDRERCFKAGMNDYLSKPIQANELFERVESLLGVKAVPAGQAGKPMIRNEEGGERSYPNLERIIQTMSKRLTQDSVAWEAQLLEAVDAQKWDEVRMLAHTIRGTADILNCRHLSSVSAAMEQAAALADGNAVRALMPELVADLQDLASSRSEHG